MTTVEIGGLTFHGTTRPTGLHFRDIPGWSVLPSTRSRSEPRPRAHGDFVPDEVFREGASPTIDAYYRGTSRVDAAQMRDRLLGALARRAVVMSVTDELGMTSRAVEVRSVRPGPIVGYGFDVPIDVFAHDPLRYGPPVSASTGLQVAGGGLPSPLTWPLVWAAGGSDGNVRLANVGTEETWPTFSVAGGMSRGFSVTEVETGREIRVERPIPIDSVVAVDSRTGWVTIDGPANDISGAITRADWWPVPAGGVSTVHFEALGDVTGVPTLTASCRPAYW